MVKRKVALVTGASSGLGLATASLLADNGFTVFGTSRRPDRSTPYPFSMVRLDVRSEESVRECAGRILRQEERLDVLVNNAGYQVSGACEETSVEEAREQFDTNFFGILRMVRAVLPVMRRQGEGHIINIGSLSGLVGVPFHGLYSASKFAVKGLSEALRHEVRGFNIRVSVVEAGIMKTNLEGAARQSAATIPDYSPMRERALRVFHDSVHSADDPKRAAALILSIVTSRRPRLEYRVGRDAVTVPRLKVILPEGAFEKGMRRRFHLDG